MERVERDYFKLSTVSTAKFKLHVRVKFRYCTSKRRLLIGAALSRDWGYMEKLVLSPEVCLIWEGEGGRMLTSLSSASSLPLFLTPW